MARARLVVYALGMSRLLCLFMAAALALGSAAASAEPVKKRPTARWQGYGFLPGYQQPLNNSAPLYKQKDALRRLARQNRRPWYIDPTPGYYDWNGDPRYFGRPDFYGGRYNGGGFGPCWTRTPIGPVWNCG
jgi:opacity protein-like surface antigen